MRILGRFLALGLFCSVVHLCASGQAPRKILLVVSCTCDDAIGKSYLSAFRTAVENDVHYHEVSSEEGRRKNAVRVSIVSKPLSGSDGTERALLSIACVHDGVTLEQTIETCSHIPVQESAQAMLQELTTWDAM